MKQLRRIQYDKALFVKNENKISYEDKKYTSRLGVDVSVFQGDIDWEQVKAAGYEFAILRIGYRGYGEKGTLNADEKFEQNMENARKAGIDVGVYFFSQAVNEEEAKEEADFVLEHLKGQEHSDAGCVRSRAYSGRRSTDGCCNGRTIYPKMRRYFVKK